MKILYFSTTIAISETFIYELSKGLALKNDVTHCVTEEPYYKENIKFKIINFEISKKLTHYLSYIFESRGHKILYKLRVKKACKALYSELSKNNVVYIDYGTNAVRILPVLIELKKPFIVHFHGFDITSELKNANYKNDILLLFKHASFIVAASYHVKRLLVINGCDSAKIKVVRLGLSTNNKPLNLTWDQKEIDFVFVGRLTPKKNPIALIYSFYHCYLKRPSVNLHIIGGGDLLQPCKALCEKLGIANSVVFRGALDNAAVIDIMNHSKIYVQHSVTPITGDQEGFAISIAEAASLKLPVVSTFHNGIPENVIHNKSGILVKEYDYESMGEKMLYLINNPDIAKEMGEYGRKHIIELCSNDNRISAIEELLNTAITVKDE